MLTDVQRTPAIVTPIFSGFHFSLKRRVASFHAPYFRGKGKTTIHHWLSSEYPVRTPWTTPKARTDLQVLEGLHDDRPREGLEGGLPAGELAVLPQHHLEVEGLVVDMGQVPHRHNLRPETALICTMSTARQKQTFNEAFTGHNCTEEQYGEGDKINIKT